MDTHSVPVLLLLLFATCPVFAALIQQPRKGVREHQEVRVCAVVDLEARSRKNWPSARA